MRGSKKKGVVSVFFSVNVTFLSRAAVLNVGLNCCFWFTGFFR